MAYLWHLYWPMLAAGFAVGLVTGLFALRADRAAGSRYRLLALGAAVAAAAAALWHGPAGAAERYRSTIEQAARATLTHYEMSQVEARLQADPLTRRLLLSGPADAFQRGELRRIMEESPGVADVRWRDSPRRPFMLPLLGEAELFALISFGLGLLLAYLVELRRRSRAEWRW